MTEYIMESVPLTTLPGESKLVMRGEIVRCRDCVHLATFQHSPDTVCCGRLSSLYQVEPGGFCSWGEVKTKEVR